MKAINLFDENIMIPDNMVQVLMTINLSSTNLLKYF
jgi:hypothetical protein